MKKILCYFASAFLGVLCGSTASAQRVVPLTDTNGLLLTPSVAKFAKANGLAQGAIIAIEGDSRNALPTPTTNCWMNYMRSLSPIFSSASVISNFALGGDTCTNMVGEYATQAHLIAPGTNRVGYFFFFAGINGLYTLTDATNIYSAYSNVMAKAKADGYITVAFTDTGTAGSSERNAAVTAYNNMIRAGGYDFLVDAALLFKDNNDTKYFLDTTHLTDLGSQIVAQEVARVLGGARPQNSPAILSDVTLNGVISKNTNGVYTFSDVYQRGVSTGTVTGTLKITVPTGAVDSMVFFTVEGYSHTNGAWRITIGGYTTTANGGGWSSGSGSLDGSQFSSVRLAYDGTNACLLLGTTNTAWWDPQFSVTHVIVGFVNAKLWGAGWSSSFLSNEIGITNIYNPPLNVRATADTLIPHNGVVNMTTCGLINGNTTVATVTNGQIVTGIGAWGWGIGHSQFSFKAGKGWEALDATATGPSVNNASTNFVNAFVKGLGTSSTNTATIGATGWTNDMKVVAVIYGLTGTDVVQTNFSGSGFSRGTITNATDVILKPGAFVNGTGCSALGVGAF